MDPETLDQITIPLSTTSQILLASAIMTLMFAIALGLTLKNFSFLKTAPHLFYIGLFVQIIALPIVTIAVIAMLGVPASIALGMIVVASCPGGSVSNFMSWLAKGDVAYSVSLTAGSSIIASIWTPLAILIWSDIYPPTAALLETINFSRIQFIVQTTMMLALPLIGGMITNHFAPKFAARARKPLGFVGAFVMLCVIIIGVIDFAPLLASAWMLILVPAIIHNGVAFGLGAVSGLFLNATPAQKRALIFEIGIQNSGLAVVLMLSQFNGLGGAAAIAAVWGVWHFVSGGALIALFRTLDRRKMPL